MELLSGQPMSAGTEDRMENAKHTPGHKFLVMDEFLAQGGRFTHFYRWVNHDMKTACGFSDTRPGSGYTVSAYMPFVNCPACVSAIAKTEGRAE